MITDTERWTISKIYAHKRFIDPRPDFQRPAAWTLKQKQLLIDSILRSYDIPKLYFLKVDRTDGINYEVIDGQQRIISIWGFCEGQFRLDKNMKILGNKKLGGMLFGEFDQKSMDDLNSRKLDIVLVRDVIQNNQVDEVREMFLRLQKGTNLKAQEIRNAMLGEMRDFVTEVADHNFFLNCGFKNSRFTYDLVAAQVICLELSGGPTNVRNKELTVMYEEHKSFDKTGTVAKEVKNVLNFLERIFVKKSSDLTRYNVIALYCLISKLQKTYVCDGMENDIREWFFEFENIRRKDNELPIGRQKIELVDYKRSISYSTDSKESIQKRFEYLEESFLLKFNDLEPKNSN